MPLYTHFCLECGKNTEHFCKIDDRKQFVPCETCGASAERIIASNIQRVEPTWLESAKMNLHSQDRHKITDRNSLASYCKREGVVQVG